MFFDGVRLMSHDMFQTCAPKTVAIQSGYKVNSTRCTIINGMLFPLVDVDDAVAYTTGVDPFARFFFGSATFSSAQAAASHELAEKSGERIRVEGEKALLDGKELKPMGFFQPSATRLLDNGFTAYDWSEFVEIDNYRYRRVLAVDDRQDWLDKVQDAFGGQIEDLAVFLTTERQAALDKILEHEPDCLLLDVHLTQDEEFDGLWIANQLLKREFKGLILLCSSYGPEQLGAMQKLVKGPCRAPGKNLDAVRQCLLGK
jgi:CheY-like chemotaxis protein